MCATVTVHGKGIDQFLVAGGKGESISKRKEEGTLDILDLCFGNSEQCGVSQDGAGGTL